MPKQAMMKGKAETGLCRSGKTILKNGKKLLVKMINT